MSEQHQNLKQNTEQNLEDQDGQNQHPGSIQVSLDDFYTDIISSAIFYAQVQFLKLYSKLIKNYQQIIDAQNVITLISYELIKQNTQKPAQILQIVKKYQKQQEKARAITMTISIRLTDIKKQLIKRQITMGNTRLIDNNWKLVKIVSASGNAYHKQTYKDKYILNLILYLRKNESQDVKFSTIDLEFTKNQLQQLILKLKQIKKELAK